MAEEISTDVSMLEDSIDETSEMMLDLYGQHGSQAEQILGNMQQGAVAMAEDQAGQLGGMNDPSADLYGQAAGVSDAQVNELMMDWDALVGGITREMAASQQSAMNRIETQGAATQNYLDALSAALPSLEARLEAQIEAARQASFGRGGSGSGTGPGPDPLITGVGSENPYLQAINAAGGGGNYLTQLVGAGLWAQGEEEALASGDPNAFTNDGLLSLAEQEALSELWGIDADAWGSNENLTYRSSIEEGIEIGFDVGESLALHGERLSELYGVEVDAVQAAYANGVNTGAGGDMAAMFDAMIMAGLDPETAYTTIWNNKEYFAQEDPKYQYLINNGEEEAANIYAAEAATALKWNFAFTDLINGNEPNWELAFGSIMGPHWFTPTEGGGWAHSDTLWPGTLSGEDRAANAYALEPEEVQEDTSLEDYTKQWMVENDPDYTIEDKIAPKGTVGNLDRIVETEGAGSAYEKEIEKGLKEQEEQKKIHLHGALFGEEAINDTARWLAGGLEDRDLTYYQEPLQEFARYLGEAGRGALAAAKPDTSNVNPGGGHQSLGQGLKDEYGWVSNLNPVSGIKKLANWDPGWAKTPTWLDMGGGEGWNPADTARDLWGFINKGPSISDAFQGGSPRNTEPIDLMANQNRLRKQAEDPMGHYQDYFLDNRR